MDKNEHHTSISIRPIPMTSYLRIMGTGSVRPEGRETEKELGEFFEAGTKDQLGDSLLLEHRVLGLENFCLQVQRDQKATVNQTPAILTAYCSQRLQTNLAFLIHLTWLLVRIMNDSN